jgi:hypothetical protein
MEAPTSSRSDSCSRAGRGRRPFARWRGRWRRWPWTATFEAVLKTWPEAGRDFAAATAARLGGACDDVVPAESWSRVRRPLFTGRLAQPGRRHHPGGPPVPSCPRVLRKPMMAGDENPAPPCPRHAASVFPARPRRVAFRQPPEATPASARSLSGHRLWECGNGVRFAVSPAVIHPPVISDSRVQDRFVRAQQR